MIKEKFQAKDLPQGLTVAFERIITYRVIEKLIANGYSIELNEENPSSDVNEIHTKLGDEGIQDKLIVRSEDGKMGWLLFVYGNSGFDVVSDYSVNLEPLLMPIIGIELNTLASRFEAGDFTLTLEVKE